MINTSILIGELKLEEGLKLTIYNDTEGIPTIGYGHNLNEPISTNAAFTILVDDVNEVVQELTSALPFVITLDDVRASVFLDMCYNMGIESLLEFHSMIACAKVNDWFHASQAGLDSKWARVDVPERAKVLMQRLLTGVL